MEHPLILFLFIITLAIQIECFDICLNILFLQFPGNHVAELGVSDKILRIGLENKYFIWSIAGSSLHISSCSQRNQKI